MTRRNWDTEDEDFDGEEFDNDSNLVKDLRKQLKAALKANEELTDQVGTLSKTTRSQSLKDVLTSKSLNPKLAGFYPADGEVTPEAVEAWVTEYADVFGISTQGEQESEDSDAAAEAALHQRMSTTTDRNSNGGDPAKFADIATRIAGASNLEELQKLLAGQ